jgi:hypothetical protein
MLIHFQRTNRLIGFYFFRLIAATVGAIFDFRPHFFPLFAPCKRAIAGDTYFLRQICFFYLFGHFSTLIELISNVLSKQTTL